jgi:putative DNA primase/helicase
VHSTPQTSIADSPPEPLGVLADSIPDPLKMYPCWVNWKYAWHDGKWTKHPYNPRTGRKASSTNLLTWRTFEETLEAWESGAYDGIGFVFSSGDPYAGVDMDHCRNPETGEIEGWATNVIEGLDSYAELSPSGKGVHVIVKGKVPTPLKHDRIEIYSAERYFTVTGHILEKPAA